MTDGAPTAGDGQLVTQNGDAKSVNMGQIPADSKPELNEAQKTFAKIFEGNEQMGEFATAEDPFKALSEKLAKAPETATASLAVPNEKSTPEEITAFRIAIGAPENAEGYAYELPTSEDELIKTLLPTDAPFAEVFRGIADKHHIPKAAWDELKEAYNQTIVEAANTSAEIGKQALQNIKESWTKEHGVEGLKVESVFQKYLSQANPAETQILSSLTGEQVAALGSVIYKQSRRFTSEDGIDTKNIGSSTMTDTEYVTKQSALLAEKRALEASGNPWNPKLRQVEAELKQLKDNFANSRSRG